ncbi:MAG: sulfite exporter TauE/SafE family protein [Bacteroidota bacterium]
MSHWEILLFFLIIAFAYATVGLGGGSSYLAILAMYELPFNEIRLIALACNIIVVTSGTLVFISKKQVNWQKIIPLVAISIPMSFLGARLKISQDVFFIILGFSLLIASVLLWIKTKSVNDGIKNRNGAYAYIQDGSIGGIIGFLSGLVGIGGGIFLSPLLNLMKWDKAKKIAATASIFILFNSISGILGQISNISNDINYNRLLLLCIAVFIGGQIGSHLSASKFNVLIIRRATALLVFIAGTEVLFKHLHL